MGRSRRKRKLTLFFGLTVAMVAGIWLWVGIPSRPDHWIDNALRYLTAIVAFAVGSMALDAALSIWGERARTAASILLGVLLVAGVVGIVISGNPMATIGVFVIGSILVLQFGYSEKLEAYLAKRDSPKLRSQSPPTPGHSVDSQ